MVVALPFASVAVSLFQNVVGINFRKQLTKLRLLDIILAEESAFVESLTERVRHRLKARLKRVVSSGTLQGLSNRILKRILVVSMRVAPRVFLNSSREFLEFSGFFVFFSVFYNCNLCDIKQRRTINVQNSSLQRHKESTHRADR